MNISQHLANYISKELHCKHVFTLTGGGAMFLNDAFGNEKEIKAVYCHHEQAASMAAVGYSKCQGIGACVTTTGCGATNTLTGLLDAWQDNVPVLFVSGNVKSKETSYLLENKIRAFGVQEANIIPIVKSITKECFFIESVEIYKEIIINLKKYLFNNRPGPVWLDIPMDVQSKILNSDDLNEINQKKNFFKNYDFPSLSGKSNEFIALERLIKSSKKPIFLVGNGLKLSNNGKGINLIKKISEQFNIPIVSTYLGIDFFKESFGNFFGVVGLKAARIANLLINNSDLIIVIGSRLATSVIGFEYELFAKNAKKVIIDIDEIEHKKPTIKLDLFLKSDAYNAINLIDKFLNKTNLNFKAWLKTCKAASKILPRQEQFSPESKVSIFDVVRGICFNCGDQDILVSDAGSSYYVASMMFTKLNSQRYVTSGAQADMGFALPASIGCSFSLNSCSRVHCLVGDGSFQLNIQELQTIKHYQLPINIIVLNNDGYLSIRATQKNFFPGRDCGTDSSNGVSFPKSEALASAYQIKYASFTNSEELNQFILKQKESSIFGPQIIEVFCPRDEIIIPRSQTIKTDEGKLISAPLSNMAPEISEEKILKLNNIGLFFL